MKSAKAIIALLIVLPAVFIWWRTVRERQFREDVLSAVRKNDTNQLWSLARVRGLQDKWQEADRSPLSVALDRGHDEAALVLIKAGFPVNITNEHGMTFLMAVCFKGDYELAKALLEAGADVHAKGILGVNSLDSAVISGNEKLVELLLVRGADVKSPMSLEELLWVMPPREAIMRRRQS